MLFYVIKYYMHTALQVLAMSMKRWRAFVVPRQISWQFWCWRSQTWPLSKISLLSICEVDANCSLSDPVSVVPPARAHRSSVSALASRAQNCSSPVNATYEIIHCTFIMHGHIAKRNKIKRKQKRQATALCSAVHSLLDTKCNSKNIRLCTLKFQGLKWQDGFPLQRSRQTRAKQKLKWSRNPHNPQFTQMSSAPVKHWHL